MGRVSIHDLRQSMRLAFWTNQCTLPPATISELYRARWQVELFFRWVKQYLRIRNFYGTSPNAGRVQLRSAISVYFAIAINRKETGITTNLRPSSKFSRFTLCAKCPSLNYFLTLIQATITFIHLTHSPSPTLLGQHQGDPTLHLRPFDARESGAPNFFVHPFEEMERMIQRDRHLNVYQAQS